MSLMRTLATVAAGVAMAKGAKAMMQGRRGGGMGGLGGALGGGLLGQLQDALQGGGMSGGTGGGLGQILAGGSGGGLGGMLDQLAGGSGRPGGSPLDGLGALLGGGAAGGALGGLLASRSAPQDAAPSQGFGERLNGILMSGQEPPETPTPDEEAAAALMIRAMIMAAKSDGRIDDAERNKLLGALQDASPEEQAFIHEALQEPVDPDALARQIPDIPGLKRQVYASALMAIELDSQAEAEFLQRLATGMGMTGADLQAVHDRMGLG